MRGMQKEIIRFFAQFLLKVDLPQLGAQRKSELSSSSSNGPELLLSSALQPEAVQLVDAAAVVRFITAVEAAIAAATSDRLKQLVMINTSKRCAEGSPPITATRAVS